ncbi:HAMP domain-containing sensor histidine kinase [soil metagenome]
MKLLTKTSLIYILSTALVFLIGGIIFYHNLRNIVDEEATEHIQFEKSTIEAFVKEHNRIPVTEYMNGDYIVFRTSALPVKEIINDTTIYSKNEQEFLPYRSFTFPILADGINYEVKISRALFESDDLVETILNSFIYITVILLVITILVNRIASKRLWKPFFSSVGLLHKYKIDEHQMLTFENTSTSEFKELNSALAKMTEKIAADYNNLKAFTENASHELQTPLSVILASTELLLQQENLSEKQSEAIHAIHQTVRKLARLNQTLLLLAKIENKQFGQKENIDVSFLLKNKLEFYSELISLKEIRLEKNILPGKHISIHPALAEILISNLLTNAIRHNTKQGKIIVILDNDKLVVSNSGEQLQDSSKLFERFYKENISSESTGLGLALVKQIVDSNGMKIHYSYVNGMHSFEILLVQN